MNEENLGNYSCSFGNEARIDFVLAGTGHIHFELTFVLLSAHIHINHQYLHCVTMFEWCKMQSSLIIILFVRVVHQLHISVRCEISPLSATLGTLQWLYARWRRANQNQAPGTGTGQMVQTRWVNWRVFCSFKKDLRPLKLFNNKAKRLHFCNSNWL